MLIDKKVQNYVRAVASKVPAKEKGRVTRELTDMIYEMMEGYAGDHEPDILDCRDVLRDLGTPDQVALNYMETKETRKKHVKGKTLRALENLFDGKRMQLLHMMYMILAVAAGAMVLVGIIGLATQAFPTTLPIFVGVVIEVALAILRSIVVSHELKRQHE